MSQTVAEQPFSYATMDDLAAQASAAVVALWALREDLPVEEFVSLVVGVVVSSMVQAEQYGRLYGEQAVPLDGRALVPDDGVPRRPSPDNVQQRNGTAPPPEPVIDFVERQQEIEPRVTKAVTTLADEGADLQRVERFVVDEVVSQAQRGYQDGIRAESPLAAPRLVGKREKVVVAFDGSTSGDSIVLVGATVSDERYIGLEKNREARQTPRTKSVSARGYRRGINPNCCMLCFWLWKEGYVYPIDQPMHRHIGCRCVPVPTTDPPGRWKMSDDEQKLLADLYAKYQEPKNEARRAAQKGARRR